MVVVANQDSVEVHDSLGRTWRTLDNEIKGSRPVRNRSATACKKQLNCFFKMLSMLARFVAQEVTLSLGGKIDHQLSSRLHNLVGWIRCGYGGTAPNKRRALPSSEALSHSPFVLTESRRVFVIHAPAIYKACFNNVYMEFPHHHSIFHKGCGEPRSVAYGLVVQKGKNGR